MAGYTKLFSTILTSTIWQEDSDTRVLWVTMLALADQNGKVDATLPGLANIANITIEACEKAITKFESPDKYSRSKKFQGRRIKYIKGGWRILNYAEYRDKMRDRAGYYRNYRATKRNQAQPLATTGNRWQPISEAEAEALIEKKEKKEKKENMRAHRTKPVCDNETFDRFWDAYPKKQKKLNAQKAWHKLKPDTVLAEQIIRDVRIRSQRLDWLKENGKYVPMPTTYLNGQRWTDELPEPKRGDFDWYPDEEEAEAIFRETETKTENEKC